MSQTGGSWFGNSNIKGYLFFLLLTTIIAIFIKLANTYATTRTIHVEIQEVPQDVVITPTQGNDLIVQYEASGFGLVGNSFRESVLKIPFADLRQDPEGGLKLSAEGFSAGVRNLLDIPNGALDVTPNELLFQIDSLSSRVIPVRAAVAITFESGYGSVDSLVVTPSRVKIIGGLKEINATDTIYTEAQTFDNIQEHLETTVALDVSGLGKDVVVTPSNVSVVQRVEKFTEGSVTVPIGIQGTTSRNIQLFPDEVTLFFTAPISEFERIKEAAFKVNAIVNSDQKNQSHLTLVVKEVPSVVSSTRLSLNQVQYVIVDE